MQIRKSKYNPPSRFNRIASGFLYAFLLAIGSIHVFLMVVNSLAHTTIEWFKFAWRNGEVDSDRWIAAKPTTFRKSNVSLTKRLSAVFLTALMAIGVWTLILLGAIPGFLYFITRGFLHGMEHGLSSGYKRFIASIELGESKEPRYSTHYQLDKKPIASLAERIVFSVVFIPLFPIISAIRLVGNLLTLPYKIYKNTHVRWSEGIFNHLLDFLLSPMDAFVLGFNRGHKGIISYLNYKPKQIFRYSEFIKGDKLDLFYKDIYPSDIPYIIELLNHHPEIKNVDLSNNNLGDEGAKLFARLNKTVTTLDLEGNKITAQGAEDFAVENKTVTSLSLRHNNIGAIGAKNFAKANQFVTTLNLSGNQIGPVGARDFAKENKVVTTLVICDNHIGDQGAEDFAAANTVITKADLSQNNIGANGTTNFAKKNMVISSVNLSHNPLGSEGAIGFAKNNKIARIVKLSHTKLGTLGMVGFAQFNDTAMDVNFAGNIILGEEDIANFAKYNKAPTINLRDTSLGSQGLVTFAMHNEKATTVNVELNNIQAEGFIGFANHNKIVRNVRLGDNNIDLAGLEEFFKRNKVATTIGLGGTVNATNGLGWIKEGFGDKGAKIIAKFNTVAREIDLSRCNITNEGAKALLEDSLVHVKYKLEDNNISQELLDEIREEYISRAVLFTSSVAVAAERLDLGASIYSLIPEILKFAGTDITLKNNHLSATLPTTKFFKENVKLGFPTVANTETKAVTNENMLNVNKENPIQHLSNG